jgi:hypothetical protein
MHRCSIRHRSTENGRSVRWLTDNGPPYTANEARDFGAAGLVVCMTPAYPSESNGMEEAFVKSFKRATYI